MSALSKEKIDPGILGERAHSIYFSLLLLFIATPTPVQWSNSTISMISSRTRLKALRIWSLRAGWVLIFR